MHIGRPSIVHKSYNQLIENAYKRHAISGMSEIRDRAQAAPAKSR
jgi:hypothetical protein